MYAALGIHGCLPHSHGSQGCCSYHRSTLSRHYKEPVMAATSSFTEGSSVFGGQANLPRRSQNIFTVYQPDVIAVHTTCLSETIGDDIPQIAEKPSEKGLIPAASVIHANTPSYVGAAPTGFANMTAAMVKYFAQSTSPTKVAGRVNVIPGWVEPADMREIKRRRGHGAGIDRLPGHVRCPGLPADRRARDVSQRRRDGRTVAGRRRFRGDHRAGTGLLGTGCQVELTNKCGVPHATLPLPIGLEATDRFILELRKHNGGNVPQEITDERGRLIDLITDMHQYFYNKTAALWGDPDQLVSLSQLLLTVDILPKYVVTGTPGKKFLKRMGDVLQDRKSEVEVRQGPGADLFLMHQWIKNEKVDLLIGNTYGKYISRDEGIPLVRHGFPILDRVGHQFFPTVGYRGAIRLLEQILEALMQRQDDECSEERFELTM
jgi:nitrogenase molybdenum-iron protein beta chain